MKTALAALGLASLAASLLAIAGCSHDHTILICDACIQREGQIFCGRTQTDQNKEKQPVTEDEGKLGAGRAACVEYAARKGGGYAGPPYEKALAECAKSVTMKDLMRTKCDEEVVRLPWNPKEDGGL